MPTFPSTPLQIQIALISHTNAGKTTLARTLTGLDVGEVRDAPHVTSFSESHILLQNPAGDQLLLWDTPGFGDSVRLSKRLGMADNPIGWFLREVLDRYRDRTFWLSQQALRTARETADVVLYLVNSSEDPQDAGYLAPEMAILQWLGKPVIVLLNQMGSPRPPLEELAELQRWQSYLAAYPVVQKVLALDAFARCWVHERVFYDALAELIPDEKKSSYSSLFQVWQQENENRFHAAMAMLALQLMKAAQDQEALPLEETAMLSTVLKVIGMGKQREQKRHDKALQQLMLRLNENVLASTADLLKLHRLDAGAAHQINQRVHQQYVVRAPLDAKQAGLLGAMLSGAATGVSADLMAGGLSFGAGALVGGILGALSFAGAAWAFNASTDRKHPQLRFSDDFLHSLLVAALLRYLAVAHFGRGRGNFAEGEAPLFWQAEVEAVLSENKPDFVALWQSARSTPERLELSQRLSELLLSSMSQILRQLYP
jgi:GTPase SAR1 family protein